MPGAQYRKYYGPSWINFKLAIVRKLVSRALKTSAKSHKNKSSNIL